MPRLGSSMLVFPRFAGVVKRLILANLIVFFALLLLKAVNGLAAGSVLALLVLIPGAVAHGYIWQIVTYSFINQGIFAILFNMLSLWFIGSYLEEVKGGRWIAESYFLSVIGGAVVGTALSFLHLPRLSPFDVTAGATSGIFGLLAAFAVLFGEQQFMLFPLPIGIKAKYLVIIYALIAIVSLFGGGSILPYIVYLSGGIIGFFYARGARGRGFSYAASERYFGLRNEYYRWKRRRAARKFQVYMRKHGREDIPLDNEGRYVDPDNRRNPNDRRWMN